MEKYETSKRLQYVKKIVHDVDKDEYKIDGEPFIFERITYVLRETEEEES